MPNLKNILEEVRGEFDKSFNVNRIMLTTPVPKEISHWIMGWSKTRDEDIKSFITYHITEAVKVALEETDIEKQDDYYPDDNPGATQSAHAYNEFSTQGWNEAVDEHEAKKKEFLS